MHGMNGVRGGWWRMCCCLLSFAAAGHVLAWQMKQAPLMTRWAALVDTNAPWPEYPRPQLVRTDWLSLNGLWQFQPGATNDPPPVGQTLSNEILVPYPMESALSGVMQYHEFSWYRRLFTVPPAWNGKKIILHFEAVNWQATVYVNGILVGVHKGGYDPFRFDITPSLRSGTNELMVNVYSPVDSGGEPRGKQTVYPGGIMYTSSSGIWQTVWLEPVDASGVRALHLVRRGPCAVAPDGGYVCHQWRDDRGSGADQWRGGRQRHRRAANGTGLAGTASHSVVAGQSVSLRPANCRYPQWRDQRPRDELLRHEKNFRSNGQRRPADFSEQPAVF